ncbi:MAG: hypothetical protein VYD19_02655, partial [Myxococcota bacterium]|nr:hypothetical protein [Myxococcota bacterium]
ARWEAKKLLGARRRYYRAETQPLGENLALRVTYRGGELSETLQVEQRGAALFHKGDQVGKLSADELQLCSGPWAHFCSLRYQEEGRKIYIEFRDPDLRRVRPAEYTADRGDWYGVEIMGRAYELFLPKGLDAEEGLDLIQNPKLLIRLGGETPQRLSLIFESLGQYEIRLQGLTVGHLDFSDLASTSFCSGDYADRCRVYFSDGQLHIIPRN